MFNDDNSVCMVLTVALLAACAGNRSTPPTQRAQTVHVDSAAKVQTPPQTTPAVAVDPWVCSAYFEHTLLPEIDAVWPQCPAYAPMVAYGGLCRERNCMQPCEHLLQGRTHDRYYYDRDGKLMGTWGGSNGRYRLDSLRRYDSAGRLVSLITRHYFADLAYQGERLVRMVFHSDVRGVHTFEYSAEGELIRHVDTGVWTRPITTSFTWDSGKLVSESKDADMEYDAAANDMVFVDGEVLSTLEYDAEGYLSCVRGRDHHRCLEYDERRRVVSVGDDIALTYDAKDRLILQVEQRQRGDDEQFEVRDEWRYECDTPAEVAELFEPRPESEVADCMSDCIDPNDPNDWTTICRARCEGIGREALGPPFTD